MATGFEPRSIIISEVAVVGMSGFGLVPRNCSQKGVGALYAASLRSLTTFEVDMLICEFLSGSGPDLGVPSTVFMQPGKRVPHNPPSSPCILGPLLSNSLAVAKSRGYYETARCAIEMAMTLPGHLTIARADTSPNKH